FDPVHPLPEKPRRERKKKTRPPEDWPDISVLSQAWRERFRSLRETAEKSVPDLRLPDSWPVAQIPAEPARIVMTVAAPVAPETFEILAYRFPTAAEEPFMVVPNSQPQATILIDSPAEATPPAPKHLTACRQRERFAWESPEMWREEED
ncbi:MAG TPA: hypothetical protein VKH44_08200, partial [Pirellulaceae bacterium]|nr:hypothetical protein [Pirellulaceae bacterium]